MADQQPQGRNSEGVVAIRHPRSEGAIEQGWLAKATGSGTFYEARTDFGWYSATQSIRAQGAVRFYGERGRRTELYYQTAPEQGWLRKPTGTFYEARTGFGWYHDTFASTPRHPARDLDRWDQDDTNFDVIVNAPAINDWFQDTVRTASGPRYLRDGGQSVGWIFPTLPVSSYDPAPQDWTIHTERMGLELRGPRDTTPDLSWLANASALTGWNLPADRVSRLAHLWPDTQQTNPWLGSVSPIVGWNAPTDRLSRALGSWKRETSSDLSWLSPNLPQTFDPALQGWIIPADRMAHALGRWTAETNPTYGWITPDLLIVFDPAVFPGIAELVGWSTPKSASLSMQRAVFVYDLSWLHDVIPLTDPVASTFIRLRPIAPIVHARRRRRR